MTHIVHPCASIVRPAVLAVLAGLALALVPASDAQATHLTCQLAGSKTETSSRNARAFSRRTVVRGSSVRRWYGCLHSRNRRYVLGDVGPSGEFLDRVAPLRLAGRFVGHANEFTASSGDAVGAIVVVRDLRTGAVRHRFENASDFARYDVTDLEQRTSGSVAWIAATSPFGPPTTNYEVRAMSGSSERAVLDSGPGIEPRSLTLRGTTLRWRNAGAERSVTLE
jgi:hypothetical protein